MIKIFTKSKLYDILYVQIKRKEEIDKWDFLKN